MSFAVALEQIQKRSWWGGEDATFTKGRRLKAEESRRKVLQAIRDAGKPVNCQFVVKATGMTNSSVRHHTEMLVIDGRIERVQASSNGVLWRAIP
ncbi:MAG: hypothetical protein MUE63_00060 [Xanthomonadales bacterium]|jgi:hypothetical protein|nr:hypothetical protein [Xanthomonadales bacterium]